MTTGTQTTETTQVYRVYIKAAPEAIWEAITKPEWTVKYGYAPSWSTTCAGWALPRVRQRGHEALGCPDVISDGEVIEADPPRRLVQTWRMTMTPEAGGRGVLPGSLTTSSRPGVVSPSSPSPMTSLERRGGRRAQR